MMAKLKFLLSHDSSEIILICWFAAQETFQIIIRIENTDAHAPMGGGGGVTLYREYNIIKCPCSK